MRKMHKHNLLLNKSQLTKRKDDADISCISQDIPLAELQNGDHKWFLQRREVIRKQQEKREEEERKKKLLLNPQPSNNYQTDLLQKGVNGGSHQQNGLKSNEQGLSQQQMMEFGYMFLNGNIDDFLNNKTVSEEQKKAFLNIASNSKQYQDYLVQAATQKKFDQIALHSPSLGYD